MIKIPKGLKKILLKRKFVKQYNAYMDKFDEVDCGGHLAELMSPRLRELKAKLKTTYNKLKKCDDKLSKIIWLEDPCEENAL